MKSIIFVILLVLIIAINAQLADQLDGILSVDDLPSSLISQLTSTNVVDGASVDSEITDPQNSVNSIKFPGENDPTDQSV